MLSENFSDALFIGDNGGMADCKGELLYKNTWCHDVVGKTG
ncbi:hypothetical protein Xbed_01442 [Xenorhabdus beddingii]|uniref:Uncharacterized protein n=1 Tax=Xenorhabdus beddingii TaxID=40578 RepID=A0A1Y2SRF4_9GAMM|nr:hypothetical protein Xbed_01442 [Xenorhabdus beddingii]